MEINMRHLGLLMAPAPPFLEPSVYHYRAPLLKGGPPLSVCVDSFVVVHEVEFYLHCIQGELSYIAYAVSCEYPHMSSPTN